MLTQGPTTRQNVVGPFVDQVIHKRYNLRRTTPLAMTTIWVEMGEVMNEITSLNANQLAVQAPESMPHSIEAEQQLLGAI